MSDRPNKFFDEMAEDFFAECDELLSIIKRDLLRIDSMDNEVIPAEIIEELLRSCHTLKGLTGMVGADETMRLTHSIESFLKSVNTGESSISGESIDILFRSIGIVEAQLDGLRNKKEMPESQTVLMEIEALVRKSSTRETDRPKINSADKGNVLESDESIWKFLFTPTRELFDKGININDIRDRINALGKVVSSTPKTDEDGKITFEFLVVTRQPESAFSDWTNDGISYGPSDFGALASEINEHVLNVNSNRNLNLKNVVRVDLTRLDDIMRSVGDLVISRSRLNDYLQNYGIQNKEVEYLVDINSRLEQKIREVREGIMKLRLVSTDEAFERLRFVIRDIIRDGNKLVDLKIEGREVLIDKFIMDRIFDSLLHLVRNAVSHGIESPDERVAAGKPGEASLILKASSSGNTVRFEIADDGRGIDKDQIVQKARRLGLSRPDEEVSDEEILNILCSPGFSTKEKTDMVSGRGVGMDVVKKSVTDLGGHLEMQTEKGRGTNFILTLPLTLSIVEALIIKSAGRTYAVPMPSVEEVIRIEPASIIKFEQNEIINYRGFVLPVLRLNSVFNIIDKDEADHIIVVSHGSGKVGILINRITGHREIVVRSLKDPLIKVPGIYGVTDLGNGRIVLILDVHSLITSAMSTRKEESELKV
ncbi:MAG TPA: chemotaxis protein CheA [Bacteroidales bacterium]|nr:chemotaxis protein CheA [Bacteroidales bacterium]